MSIRLSLNTKPEMQRCFTVRNAARRSYEIRVEWATGLSGSVVRAALQFFEHAGTSSERNSSRNGHGCQRGSRGGGKSDDHGDENGGRPQYHHQRQRKLRIRRSAPRPIRSGGRETGVQESRAIWSGRGGEHRHSSEPRARAGDHQRKRSSNRRNPDTSNGPSRRGRQDRQQASGRSPPRKQPQFPEFVESGAGGDTGASSAF